MTGIIDTTVPGDVAGIRTFADWLDTVNDAIEVVRVDDDYNFRMATTAWDGDAADMYQNVQTEMMRQVDAIPAPDKEAARWRSYANRLEWMREKFDEVIEAARGAGLQIDGPRIHEPQPWVGAIPGGSDAAEWARYTEWADRKRAYNNCGWAVLLETDKLERWVAENFADSATASQDHLDDMLSDLAASTAEGASAVEVGLRDWIEQERSRYRSEAQQMIQEWQDYAKRLRDGVPEGGRKDIRWLGEMADGDRIVGPLAIADKMSRAADWLGTMDDLGTLADVLQGRTDAVEGGIDLTAGAVSTSIGLVSTTVAWTAMGPVVVYVVAEGGKWVYTTYVPQDVREEIDHAIRSPFQGEFTVREYNNNPMYPWKGDADDYISDNGPYR